MRHECNSYSRNAVKQKSQPSTPDAPLLGMHDEIFHFEMFKNFMEILKYFKTPSLKYFMKCLIFIIK